MLSDKKLKLDLPVTLLERIANSAGIVALVAMVSMLVLQWSSLPDAVPVHFDAAGVVDRWGSKFELLLLPTIAIALHVFLHYLEGVPHTHNYPARLNDTNRAAFYRHSRIVLNLTKNICAIMLSYMTWQTILIAQEKASSLGLPFGLIIAVLFIVIVWGMTGMAKIK